MQTSAVSARPLLFQAPPGARAAVPATEPPAAPVDRVDVHEPAAPRPGVKEIFAIATSALAVAAAFVPAPASAATGTVVAQTLERSSRRDDAGQTHPLWGAIDGTEDAARKVGSEVRRLGESLKEAVPEPAREGVRHARETARQIDSLGTTGRIGEYNYSFDVIDADLDLRPRAGLSDGKVQVGLKVETEADLFRSRLSKVEETSSGWRVEKGLRGGLHLRHDVTALTGGSSSTDSTSRAELRAEAFQEWRGNWKGYKVRLEVAPGMAQDLLNGHTLAYARFEQGIDGGNFQFMEKDLSWTGEARQEYRYNLSGDSGYEYRVFGGVAHSFDTRLLGRKVDVDMKIGPEFRGSDASGFSVQPRVKFKVHW